MNSNQHVIFSMHAIDQIIDLVNDTYLTPSSDPLTLGYDVAVNHLASYVKYVEYPELTNWFSGGLGPREMLYPKVMSLIANSDLVRAITTVDDESVEFPDEWHRVGLVTADEIRTDDPRLDYVHLTDISVDSFMETQLPPLRHLHIYAGGYTDVLMVNNTSTMTHFGFKWTEEERDEDYIQGVEFGRSSNLEYIRMVGVEDVYVLVGDDIDKLRYLDIDGTLTDFVINEGYLVDLEIRSCDDEKSHHLLRLLESSPDLKHLGLARANLLTVSRIFPDLKSLEVRELVENTIDHYPKLPTIEPNYTLDYLHVNLGVVPFNQLDRYRELELLHMLNDGEYEAPSLYELTNTCKFLSLWGYVDYDYVALRDHPRLQHVIIDYDSDNGDVPSLTDLVTNIPSSSDVLVLSNVPLDIDEIVKIEDSGVREYYLGIDDVESMDLEDCVDALAKYRDRGRMMNDVMTTLVARIHQLVNRV